MPIVTSGQQTLVNTTTAGNQSAPTLTMLLDGGWVVSWDGPLTTGGVSSLEVFSQRYSANGTKVGDEVHVNTYTAAAQTGYQNLAALEDGGWVTIWSSFNQERPDSGWDTYMQRYNDAGGLVGGPTLVNVDEHSEVHRGITALDGGGFVITWDYGDFDDDRNDLYAKAYGAGGGVIMPERAVNSFPATTLWLPDTAALDGGGWVTAWESDYQESASDGGGVYFQAFNGSGGAIGSEVHVNDLTTGSQTLWNVVELAEGGWVVVFYSFQDDNIYQQRYDELGVRTHVNNEVVDAAGINPSYAGFATALTDGGWVVTYSGELTPATEDEVESGIFQSVYGADGLLRATVEMHVNTFIDGDQTDPIVLALAEGRWVVIWQSEGQDGDAEFDRNLYQQVFNADGTKDGGEVRVNTFIPGNQPGFFMDAEASGNTWVVSWSHEHPTAEDTSDDGVYQRWFSLDAVAVPEPPTDIAFAGAALAANEGAPINTLIRQFTAADADTNPPGLIFSLVNDAGGRFSITAAGQLRVASGVLLDFEQAASHAVRIRVSDGTSAYEENFTVSVGNVASENLTGTAGADRLVGGVGVDIFRGVGGNDILIGGGGKDTLAGGNDNDTYVLGAESDAIDTVTEAATGGTGDVITSTINRSLNTAEYANIEHLTLLGAAVSATGNARGNTLTGNTVANRLEGLGGVDTLRGLGGNDTYVVTAGDIVDEGVSGSTGVDLVTGALSINLSNLALIKGAVENATLTGAAAFGLVGNTLANRLTGNAGANTIDGKGGSDFLTGGLQNDRFAFTTAIKPTANIDHITDFRNVAGNDDRIVLDDAIFLGVSNANLAATFKAAAMAGDANDRIIYNRATGALSYDANGNAAGGATVFAIVDTKVVLTAADFLVI